MARAKVTHSDDAVTVTFKGNPKIPEPSTGVITFPGGYVEVGRTTDGKYWVHVQVQQEADHTGAVPGVITESRIDYTHAAYLRENGKIPPIPAHEDIQHMAVLVGRSES